MKNPHRALAYVISLGASVVLCHVTALAQTNATASSATNEEEPRFHKGEMDVSPFGAYVDKAGGKWGPGVALSYFLTKRFGLGAATYWTDFKGTFFDNAELEGYFRLPLLRIVAPYAVGSVGYQFSHEYAFETIGLGVDFRPFKHIDAFGDAQYRYSNDTDKSKSGAFIRVGVRLTF